MVSIFDAPLKATASWQKVIKLKSVDETLHNIRGKKEKKDIPGLY